MEDEPPDPTADQLLCPSHGKLCKKGICSGMSRLVREEERRKRKVKSGGGRRGGFCSTFGLFILFSVSVWLFVVFASCGFRFFHYSCLGYRVFCSLWFR
jgi:hypothetical protein